MKTTAEGVETRDQADMMIETGCDLLQGFLFYRPLSAQQLKEHIVLIDGVKLAS
jgi:diguanylate cyclase